MKSFLGFVLSLALLSGCANYHASSLSMLEPQFFEQHPDLEGLKIGCKIFSPSDCLHYFNRNILVMGYQPIQLTFSNESDVNYLFTTQGMSLPCAEPYEVSKLVHTSTMGRIAGYSFGGLFFSTLAFIPAVVDGILSYNANKELDRDYFEKSLDYFYIKPKSDISTVLFIPLKDFTPRFTFPLRDKDTGKLTTIGMVAKRT